MDRSRRTATNLASLFFSGDPRSPLLAPRGVFLHEGRLLVADTGQNRVFLWREVDAVIEARGSCPADLILGQTDSGATGRNGGGDVSAASLHYPSGLWSDGRRLIVADAWNHRVLIWHELKTAHGQPADIVVGQPDFHHNAPNVDGLGTPPSARSLYWCYGVWSDGRSLWIADTGNRRVLFFEEIPTTPYAAADGVIGKPDFTTRHYDERDAVWPYSVKTGPQGQLAITDTQYYRVLLWSDWRSALTEPAEVVIGQPDFTGNGQNQFAFQPAAHTLSWCYDACFHGQGLLVADTGNSRILQFDRLPAAHNAAADRVIGPPDFTTGSEHAANRFHTESGLYWPFSIATQGDRLVVADTGNHRIGFYTLEKPLE